MSELKTIQIFVEEINKENGRNYKIEILKKYEGNSEIINFLEFLFNPFKITGISNKKIEKEVALEDMCHFNDITEVINYLCLNNTGSDDNLRKVQTYLYTLEESEKELAKKIITKNLQLGVDVKTINKVFPKLIPTFAVQLANKYFDNPKVLEGKEFAITTKIDGGRILVVKENGNVTCYTRAGQIYEGLVDIENDVKSLINDNFVLDGEITLLNKGNLTSKEQYKETMKITRKDGEKHGVKILVFDYLDLNEFKERVSVHPYYFRRQLLEMMLSGEKLRHVEILPILYDGYDTSVILPMLNKAIQNGEEGLMINLIDEVYHFERSNALLKVKKMQDIDLPIIGFEEGRNKFENTLGAFLVEYKGNIVRVGSGISDEIRKEVWNNRDKYLGVTIEIQYFEETSNSEGQSSLRFPVFIDFRFDKPL